MRETPRAGHRAKNGKCRGSLAKRMQTMLVKASHPHVPTVSPGGVEQVQDPRSEPACSSWLPHTSHALGSGRVTEAQEQRRRVVTGGQSLKPGDNTHQVGLHIVMGISANVGGVVAVIFDDATDNVSDM